MSFHVSLCSRGKHLELGTHKVNGKILGHLRSGGYIHTTFSVDTERTENNHTSIGIVKPVKNTRVCLQVSKEAG